jgi:ubiquinone biosynthesis protein
VEFKTVAKLNRFREIVVTLFKYGFEDLVERLNLPGMGTVERPERVESGMGTYERIRRALEDLGPTFVKLGQVMSLRPDLLPPPLIKELSRLQDDVNPVEPSTVQEMVERSLGRPTHEVFRIFDPEPVAAASLSQVHRGVLRKEGWAVAVKVQRPRIRQKVETDLDILKAVVDRIHSHVEEIRIYDLPGLLEVTRGTMIRELDFKREARHMRIARAYLRSEDDVLIPEVYDPYCTKHLLVSEYIQGSKISERGPDVVLDAEQLGKQGLRSAIRQILEHGFFHADPHPGNLLITPENRLCLLDWGMVGRLTREARYELVDFIHAVVDKDTGRLVNVLLMLASAEGDVDRRGLERDLLDILDSHLAMPIKEMAIGHLLLDITTILRQYRLRLPSDLGIMIKALITAEGSARQIYPDLDVVSEAEPLVRELAAARYKPAVLWRNLHSKLSQIMTLQGRVPRLLAQIVDKVDRGQLNIRFEHENLDDLRSTLENISNRLTFGIIIGALIIGSSMIITTGVGPLLFGFPALGIIGFSISGMLGLWLIFNIIRNRRY